jgi:hypothetical protein
MIFKSKIADFFFRMGAGLLIAILFGWAISAISYAMMPDKDSAQRDPHEVQLVIPYGTAEQVKQGAYNPSLPGSLTFVEGDVLIVKNEDKVAHQLGPMFIPPSTSSALSFDTANDYSYTCSFTPGNNIGVVVAPRVTSGLQLQAILAIALPTGAMLGLYSYMLTGKKKETARDGTIPSAH